MQPLTYDEDELIRRLRACGCSVTKKSMSVKSSGAVVEIFKVERNGYVGTVRVQDEARPLFDYEVASVLRDLRMTAAEAQTFGVSLAPQPAPVRRVVQVQKK